MQNNLTMLTDFYQLTMMQGYFKNNTHTEMSVFDMFFRENPDSNSFSILAGLTQAIEYIHSLHFTDADIQYLSTFDCFDDDFLTYLKGFKFTGDIFAMPEGSLIFPTEPIIRVTAPIFECQLIETALLNIINHQSLIATKASRVCFASYPATVLEFGLRRAQGPDAGLYGSRASYIGGCHGTSDVQAGQLFGIPVSGTHAHSWVMSFDNELDAFITYGKQYRNNCILLVDTYDTLKSGVPNAIKAFDELKRLDMFPTKYGIRLDSGDLAYLSKKARVMLDNAGYTDAIISASSDLDEYLINNLKSQGARIGMYGVGTNLITSKTTPAFGGVYKLSAKISEDGTITPKIKLSNNSIKITNPHIKNVYRLIDKNTNKIKADLITLHDETIDTTQDLVIFDPHETWKKMTLKANEFLAVPMLQPIFQNGELVYQVPTTREVRANCEAQLSLLWDEHRRIVKPQTIPVDLSQKLYDLKKQMIDAN